MTREEMIAHGRESNPGWPEKEILPWAEARLQVHPNVVQSFEQPPPAWRDTVSQIACPILFLTGDLDKGAVNTPEDVEQIAGLWRQGESVHIDGAGHSIHDDRYEPYLAAVKTFLAQVEAGARIDNRATEK
jgi:pimeloyl-ACP methyl ester carboxylesterase